MVWLSANRRRGIYIYIPNWYFEGWYSKTNNCLYIYMYVTPFSNSVPVQPHSNCRACWTEFKLMDDVFKFLPTCGTISKPKKQNPWRNQGPWHTAFDQKSQRRLEPSPSQGNFLCDEFASCGPGHVIGKALGRRTLHVLTFPPFQLWWLGDQLFQEGTCSPKNYLRRGELINTVLISLLQMFACNQGAGLRVWALNAPNHVVTRQAPWRLNIFRIGPYWKRSELMGCSTT